MTDLLRRRTSLTRLVIAILLALVLSPGLAGAGQAASDESRAGIVIYFEPDTIEYHLIDLPDSEMSGLDLLIETGHDLDVQPFGGLGEAICAIDETGCPASDCFCESYSSPAYYWQFYLWDDGQWVPQHRGAGEHTVEHGEIHAWAWTAETPELPEITFDDLIDRAISESEPTPVETPEEISSDPDPSRQNTEDESDDDRSGTSQCLQFIGIMSLLSGLVVWAGVRRYRGSDLS